MSSSSSFLFFLFFLGVIAIETIPRENDSFIVQKFDYSLR